MKGFVRLIMEVEQLVILLFDRLIGCIHIDESKVKLFKAADWSRWEIVKPILVSTMEGHCEHPAH